MLVGFLISKVSPRAASSDQLPAEGNRLPVPNMAGSAWTDAPPTSHLGRLRKRSLNLETNWELWRNLEANR